MMYNLVIFTHVETLFNNKQNILYTNYPFAYFFRGCKKKKKNLCFAPEKIHLVLSDSLHFYTQSALLPPPP
jgi:hypothetical protein